MSFLCGPPCDRFFDNSKALSIHQARCPHSTAEVPTLDAAAAARRSRKRAKVNAAAAPHLPEAGPSQIEHQQSEPEFSHSEPADFEPAPAPAPAPTAAPEAPSGRGQRAKRQTWKILEQLPPAPAEFEDVSLPDPPPDKTPPPTLTEYVWKSVKTVKNAFGVYREYPTMPTHDPDRTTSLTDQSNIPGPRPKPIDARLTPVFGADSPFGPFKNSTVFGIMNWMWSGSAMKSMSEVSKLIHLDEAGKKPTQMIRILITADKPPPTRETKPVLDAQMLEQYIENNVPEDNHVVPVTAETILVQHANCLQITAAQREQLMCRPPGTRVPAYINIWEEEEESSGEENN
ncbi:hypothetical protein C8J57DRAFT_1494275 [Mycena rebaudengoi]|nr:hypothetical protein C8J57DRAFT_1494275 [Mycena rebaudengoi]